MKRILISIAGMWAIVAIVSIAHAGGGSMTPSSREASLNNATSQSVTNGQVVTVADGINTLKGIGGADITTNTITLVNPGVIGRQAIIVMAGTAGSTGTNLIAIADLGNCKLSAAWEGATNGWDNLELISTATNVWTEIGRTDN